MIGGRAGKREKGRGKREEKTKTAVATESAAAKSCCMLVEFIRLTYGEGERSLGQLFDAQLFD
jgi:hypothetical protein